MMPKREETTLDAINTLKKRYPYAAALLVYAIIERELKFWLLRNRKQFDNSTIGNSVKILRKELQTYINLDDENFIKKCLHNCTLGTLVKILRIKAEGISTRRDNLAHHNEYLANDHRKPQTERHRINEAALKKAIDDLLFCSERFF